MINILKTLITFEFLKMVKKKKNIVALLAFVVLLVVYITCCAQMLSSYNESQLYICNESLNQIQNNILLHKSVPSTSDPNKEPLKSELQEQSLFTNRKTAILNKDWNAFLTTKIQENNNLIDGITNGTIISGNDLETLKLNNEKYKFLQTNNIKPVCENFNIQGFFFLQNVFRDIFPLFFIILILILTSDCVCSEVDYKTYKLLLTQPVSKRKILLAKYIVSVIYCFVSTVVILGIFFVILGLTQGFGAYNYPVLFNKDSMQLILNSNSSQNLTLIPLALSLLYTLPMILLIIIAFCSIALLVSTIFKSSVSSISVSITISVAIYVFTFQTKLITQISSILPFSYTNVPGLIDGSFAESLNNNSLTYLNGLIVLFIYSVACYLISNVIFKYKEV